MVSHSNMPPEKTPIIVPTNAERIAIINYCANAHILKFKCSLHNCLDWKKTGFIRLVMDVKITESSESRVFSNKEMIKQYVRQQNEKSIGYMPGVFNFIKGSNGIIT